MTWDTQEQEERRIAPRSAQRLASDRRRSRRILRCRRRMLLALRALSLVLAVLLLVSYVSGRGVFAGHGLPGLATRFHSGAEKDSRQSAGAALRAYSGDEIREELERLAKEEKDYRKILDNYEDYPEPLLAALCTNAELLPFVQGYLSADGQAHGGLTDDELAAAMPLLLQWDERWGYAAYGDSNVALSGCAPTCMSMVIVALTKNAEATPAAVADYAMREGYYIRGAGTSWSFMNEGGAHYGISGKELCLDESVIRGRLAAGTPIICSMRPGDFTTAGHFIVLAGVEDGKIIVNDPNSRVRSSMRWDYETLAGQIKNLWEFSAV